MPIAQFSELNKWYMQDHRGAKASRHADSHRAPRRPGGHTVNRIPIGGAPSGLTGQESVDTGKHRFAGSMQEIVDNACDSGHSSNKHPNSGAAKRFICTHRFTRLRTPNAPPRADNMLRPPKARCRIKTRPERARSTFRPIARDGRAGPWARPSGSRPRPRLRWQRTTQPSAHRLSRQPGQRDLHYLAHTI